jgi:hypothetical protein
MKLEELKQLMDSHSVDGELNHDELNKAINAKFDGLIDSKIMRAKDNAKDSIISEFITEQGFENIDQYTAFVNNSKSTSTELSEKVTRFETELEALKGVNGTLQAENENFKYSSKLGDVDDRYKKFVMSEIKGLVKDDVDFETAKTTYLTDNTQFLKDNESIVTKLPKGNEQSTQTDGVLAILEKKNGIKLE